MKTAALLLISAIFLTACASSGKQQPDRLDGVSPGVAQIAQSEGKVSLDDDRIVCTREKHLGSNIPKKVCMTRGEREKARIAAQTRLQNQVENTELRLEEAARRDGASPN